MRLRIIDQYRMHMKGLRCNITSTRRFTSFEYVYAEVLYIYAETNIAIFVSAFMIIHEKNVGAFIYLIYIHILDGVNQSIGNMDKTPNPHLAQ